MMLAAAVSLLFTSPVPLDMPRAEAYLSIEDGVHRLVDRYDRYDLWVSRSVDGRWIDDDGREFRLAHLDVLPPEGRSSRSVSPLDEFMGDFFGRTVCTREAYMAALKPIDKRDKEAVRKAVAALSPVETPEKETRPRRLPRGFKDVDYWQGTNTSAIVCAYLPEKSQVWRLATWQLAEGDDFGECLDAFEEELFGGEAPAFAGVWERAEEPSKKRRAARRKYCDERELLRADARHSVAAYDNWHVTDAPEFTVLDDLPPTSTFVTTITNDMLRMRRRYADTLPTHIDGSNVLCVARIFADREEYLDALAADGLSDMAWSGAYWSTARRELVAHLGGYATPDDAYAAAALLRTIRHEAFHQYLSYATAMQSVSPWLNEGYAQYFEEDDDPECRYADKWELPNRTRPSPEDLERFSLLLPGLMMMDYTEFYAGTDDERRLKYRLAWSIAVFLEKGAPKVRHNPFKDMKKDYFAALFKAPNMHRATEAALRGPGMDKFAGEWLAFWKSAQ